MTSNKKIVRADHIALLEQRVLYFSRVRCGFGTKLNNRQSRNEIVDLFVMKEWAIRFFSTETQFVQHDCRNA